MQKDVTGKRMEIEYNQTQRMEENRICSNCMKLLSPVSNVTFQTGITGVGDVNSSLSSPLSVVEVLVDVEEGS